MSELKPSRRKIVQIDQRKCDGCGLCVPSCAEGAIQIIDGKAHLVSEVYCDGLGACLGHCPQGAISIVEREAEPFDEAAAAEHARALSQLARGRASAGPCPGAAAMELCLHPSQSQRPEESSSRLRNWPVQLHLIPPQAPYLAGADLLLAADCVPFACADFHGRFLDGRPVAVGCPKLDDGRSYVEKLAMMVRTAGLRSITVVRMEVPCCTGLVRIAEAAIRAAGTALPLRHMTVSLRGEVR